MRKGNIHIPIMSCRQALANHTMMVSLDPERSVQYSKLNAVHPSTSIYLSLPLDRMPLLLDNMSRLAL